MRTTCDCVQIIILIRIIVAIAAIVVANICGCGRRTGRVACVCQSIATDSNGTTFVEKVENVARNPNGSAYEQEKRNVFSRTILHVGRTHDYHRERDQHGRGNKNCHSYGAESDEN